MTEADFEARVTALTEDMYRVAATLLRGHHDRQDAVQECIWKAWRNLRYLRDDAAFRPWLMRILINECYNVKRAHRRISPMAELPERPAPVDAGGGRLRAAAAGRGTASGADALAGENSPYDGALLSGRLFAAGNLRHPARACGHGEIPAESRP